MDLGLKNKVIMVAAASRGLGLGIARAAAADGALLSIASRTRDDIEQAAADLRADFGVKAIGCVMNASDPLSIATWTRSTLVEFGRIDGLVVNAGGPPSGKFDDFEDSDWEDAFQLTLMSAVRMIRNVLPTMQTQKSGSIVTITSSSIKEPIDVLLLSNVLRSGVVSLVKSLSFDLAADGIRINNLVPGSIDTDRIRQVDEARAANLGVSPEKARADGQASTPPGRYGTPDEFGRAGAFLLSDAASYINGATLFVDGGKSRTVW